MGGFDLIDQPSFLLLLACPNYVDGVCSPLHCLQAMLLPEELSLEIEDLLLQLLGLIHEGLFEMADGRIG